MIDAAGLNNECDYYLAEMKLSGSKNLKGVRAEVYSTASKLGGFYFNRKEESIYYEDDDLIVKILFKDATECSKFVNQVDANLEYYSLMKDVFISRTFQRVPTINPTSVLKRDYKTTDESSQDYSIALTQFTHVTTMTHIDFLTETMMIENPSNEDFMGLKCYKCHLMSQTEFPQYKDNPNNSLWMSWSTHQRFDALHTIGDHRVPQFAISFKERSNVVEKIDDLDREKVSITIEFQDELILRVLSNRVKAGATVDIEKKTIVTDIFVENAEEFETFLTHKYKETQFMWTQKSPGDDVTSEQAHDLRRSARVAAKEIEEAKKAAAQMMGDMNKL